MPNFRIVVSVSFGLMCYICLFKVTKSYIDAAIINKHSNVIENVIVCLIVLCKQTGTVQSDKYPLSRESFYSN